MTETRTKTEKLTGRVSHEETANDTAAYQVYAPATWEGFASLSRLGPVNVATDKAGNDRLVVNYEFQWATGLTSPLFNGTPHGVR